MKYPIVNAFTAITLSAAIALTVSAPANAALDATTIGVEYRNPDLATVYGSAVPSVSPFIVGAGVETVVNVEDLTFIDVDFTDLGLSLTFRTVFLSATWNDASFNGLVFTGTGIGNLASATLLPTTTFGGGAFTQSDITLVGNELGLNWSGASYVDGQRIDIAFAAVPEPATWGLMITGFGLTGAAMRRRRQTAVAA